MLAQPLAAFGAAAYCFQRRRQKTLATFTRDGVEVRGGAADWSATWSDFAGVAAVERVVKTRYAEMKHQLIEARHADGEKTVALLCEQSDAPPTDALAAYAGRLGLPVVNGAIVGAE